MKQPHLRIRTWIVAILMGTLAFPILGAVAPIAAQAKGHCTTRLTGTQPPGNQNVASGETLCVNKATVNGDINVASGGKLSVKKSTVNGSVNMASGFLTLKFCDSTQSGGSAVSLDGGTRKILMGGTKNCKGNSFSGAVNVTNNQAPVKLGKNTIGGVLTISTNAKGTSTSGNTIGGAVNATGNLTKTLISNNTITGAISCSANSPAASNGGKPNTVSGAQNGECAAPF